MRNTLKFSLLGTVLCAVFMMFSTGYSAESDNNSFDSTKSSYSSESEDEFMDRVGKIIKAADKYGSVIRGKDGTIIVGRFGTVTKAEMDRYNEIMARKNKEQKFIPNPFYKPGSNNNFNLINSRSSLYHESEEQFVKRMEGLLKIKESAEELGGVSISEDGDILIRGGFHNYKISKADMDRYNEIMKQRYEDTKNNEYMRVGNMLIGNAGESLITVDEEKRYKEIMKQRDEELIRKVEKFYEDTKNNEYMRVGNMLIGNAGKSSITVDEEKRYEEIMKQRDEE